jgi:hypothetical protein
LKDAKALEKFGFIKSRKGKSMKKLTIKFYSCTEEGAFYALAKNPKVDVLRVLDSYKNLYDVYKSFRSLVDIWGVDLFVDFARNISEFLPMIQKDGLQKALPFMFMKMKIAIDATNPDPRKSKILVGKTLEQFPQLKPMMKEWAKSINEAVGE